MSGAKKARSPIITGRSGLDWIYLAGVLAERAGFEPALGMNLNTLSRRVIYKAIDVGTERHA